MKRLACILSLSSLVAATFVACNRPGPSGERTPLIVTSITPLGSIIRNVAGDRARVEALVPEGQTATGYQPSPSDLKLIDESEIAFYNGFGYDGSIVAATSTEKRTEAVEIAPRALTPDALIQTESVPSPFLWLDPALATTYASVVKAELSRIDPDGTAIYQANLDRFAAALDRLDRAISDTVSNIPVADRKLVTQVDAFSYFARAHQIAMVGAAEPFGRPPPPTEELAASVRRDSLPAVFKTGPAPSPTMERIARDGGARYVEMLLFEALPGPPGNLNHTYLGLALENTRILAEALGGNAAPLAEIRPNDTAPV